MRGLRLDCNDHFDQGDRGLPGVMALMYSRVNSSRRPDVIHALHYQLN